MALIDIDYVSNPSSSLPLFPSRMGTLVPHLKPLLPPHLPQVRSKFCKQSAIFSKFRNFFAFCILCSALSYSCRAVAQLGFLSLRARSKIVSPSHKGPLFAYFPIFFKFSRFTGPEILLRTLLSYILHLYTFIS